MYGPHSGMAGGAALRGVLRLCPPIANACHPGRMAPQRYVPEQDLEALVEHPQNPRRGEDAAVSASIEVNGFYGAIIAQTSTGRILAGHTRRRALLAGGVTTGPVMWLDVDDATATRILLADNRTAELATWDDRQLLSVLEALALDDAALVGSGFDEEAIAALARTLAAIDQGAIDYGREWEDAGMPGYESSNLMSAYRCVIHFKSEDDADRFFDEIDRPKRKSFWWPEVDGFVGLLSDQRVVGGA